MVAVGLLKGCLTAEDYEDVIAEDPQIDKLRVQECNGAEERT